MRGWNAKEDSIYSTNFTFLTNRLRLCFFPTERCDVGPPVGQAGAGDADLTGLKVRTRLLDLQIKQCGTTTVGGQLMGELFFLFTRPDSSREWPARYD